MVEFPCLDVLFLGNTTRGDLAIQGGDLVGVLPADLAVVLKGDNDPDVLVLEHDLLDVFLGEVHGAGGQDDFPEVVVGEGLRHSVFLVVIMIDDRGSVHHEEIDVHYPR